MKSAMKRLTPAMVVAMIALLAALGGTAGAAHRSHQRSPDQERHHRPGRSVPCAKSWGHAARGARRAPGRSGAAGRPGRKAFRGPRATEARREALARRVSQAHLVLLHSMSWTVRPVSLE